MVVPKLRVGNRYINWPKEKLRWKHLEDLDLSVFDSRQVGIFIGANVVGALQQIEIRTPRTTGPYGLLTPFGWTVMGEIPKSMASTARLQCQAVFGEE